MVVKPAALLLALLALLAVAGCAATPAVATATSVPAATPVTVATATVASVATAATAAGAATEAAGTAAEAVGPAAEAATTPAKGEATVAAGEQGEAAVVIVYRRSGGFAGLDESWTVYEDGTVVDATGKTSTVSTADLANVIAQARLNGFFEEELTFDRMSSCNDCFRYQLQMSVGKQQNAVSFEDAQKDVPDTVWQLLAAVQALVGG